MKHSLNEEKKVEEVTQIRVGLLSLIGSDHNQPNQQN